jgi:hypothetical protein
MDSIVFPIKFDSTGIKKHQDGTTDYYSQLLSICMLTEPGTHPMSPQFGAYDPSFRVIDKSIFVLNASQFVPEVTVTNIDISEKDSKDGTMKVAVSFDINV